MDPDLQKIEICRLCGIEALDNSVPLLQHGILAERATHGISDSLFSYSDNQNMYLAGEIRYEIGKKRKQILSDSYSGLTREHTFV